MAKKPTLLNYLAPFIMIAIGVGHSIRHGIDLLTVIPVTLGAFALYLAIFNHALLQRVLAFITKCWLPIGQGITLILFGATFFLVFAPVGIILRLLKKDILNKDFKTDRPTYWVDRPNNEEHHYTQQF